MSDGMRRLTLPMPRLGETMEEGTVSAWLVAPGARFDRGAALLEVETDKTMVEYPALAAGTLIETLVSPGDVVSVGSPIAVIETDAAWDGAEEGVAEKPVAEEPAPMPGPVLKTPETPQDTRPRATPVARKLARSKGIALETLSGTGRRGRIEAGDVRASAGRTTGSHRALCIHGFGGLGSNWTALRAALARAGVASEAPDMPGHGVNATPTADVNVERLVAWLSDSLADSTADGAEPLHLIGHSLGAHVAVLAALRVPDRVARLTLIAPAGCGLEIDGRFLASLAKAPSAGELAHLMRRLGPTAAALPPDALRSMAAGLGDGALAPLAACLAEGDRQRIDTIAPLRALAGRLPITAIFGLNDRIIPRAHAFAMPPQVACHMVEAGHMPHWDAPDTLAEILSG